MTEKQPSVKLQHAVFIVMWTCTMILFYHISTVVDCNKQPTEQLINSCKSGFVWGFGLFILVPPVVYFTMMYSLRDKKVEIK